MAEIHDRISQSIEMAGDNKAAAAKKLGVTPGYLSKIESGQNFFSLEKLREFARIYGVDLNWLFFGEQLYPHIHASTGREIEISGSEHFYMIPLFSQTVSAGPGQELMIAEDVPVFGEHRTIPFLASMLRGHDVKNALAVEVRGDSMTGVHLNDGDYVVFVRGDIRGDGIYVLQVDDTVLVKRVQFDHIERKIIIMSENSRYPDRTEAADSDRIQILGKVYGWMHAHHY